MENTEKEKKRKLTYKERNGTTRVGDFLRKLGDSAGPILETVGKITDIKQLENLGEIIQQSDKLTPKDKELALKELEIDMMEMQLLMEKEREVTKRWQADMKADSWLSKNIRPITLAFLMVGTVTILIIDAANPNFNVPEYWVSLLGSLSLTALGGYFALREIGKYVDLSQKNKK